jgi:hypothetical protein
MSAEDLLAQVDATQVLAATSTSDLLTAYATLTHRMHAARVMRQADREIKFRQQRDMIRAEILRRTGDLR